MENTENYTKEEVELLFKCSRRFDASSTENLISRLKNEIDLEKNNVVKLEDRIALISIDINEMFKALNIAERMVWEPEEDDEEED